MSQELISKLAHVRRKQASVFSATGLSIGMAFLVLAFALEMFVDWAVEWPWAESAGMAWIVRVGILALIMAGFIWIVLNRVAGPFIFGPDDETMALAVEHDQPDLGGRLIASIQLSRKDAIAAGASPALVAALVYQTETMVRDRDFDRIIRLDTLVRTGSVSLLILILGFLGFLLCLPSSGALLRRAFLSTEAVPRKTRVTVVTGDIRVPKGEAVTIVAQADGVRPASGTLDVVYPNAKYTFSLDPDPTNKGQYFRKIENVTSTFSYGVRLNDGRGDRRYNVVAVDRPAAVSIDCTQIFPDYIKQRETPHLPGDLSVVTGSWLVISIKANKPLQQTSSNQFPFNHVHLSGCEKDFPLKVDSSDATKAATGDMDNHRGIPLPAGTTGLSIHLVDQDGIASKDPTVFRVELLPDKPPVIRITSAEAKDELVTKVASPHISFDAYDDYAIGRVVLRYTVNGGGQQEIPVPLNPPNPQSVSSAFDFDLSKIAVPAGAASLEGVTIKYWLHAEDLNNVSNPNHLPGMCDTDAFLLKVVSEDEKRRELMSRFNVLPDQIAPISEGEKKSSDSLGNMVIHGTNNPTTKP